MAIAKGLSCTIGVLDSEQGESEPDESKAQSSVLTEPLMLLIHDEKTYILYTGKQGKTYAEGTAR
jgi:hypothetical protein